MTTADLLTPEELRRKANGPMTQAMHDAGTARKTLLIHVAEDVIEELQARPDVIADYVGHPDGDVDFVFVEEMISMRMSAYTDLAEVADVADDNPNHVAVFGIVFSWILTVHGVQPPAWFVHATRVW